MSKTKNEVNMDTEISNMEIEQLYNITADSLFREIMKKCFKLMTQNINQIVNIECVGNKSGLFNCLNQDGNLENKRFITKPTFFMGYEETDDPIIRNEVISIVADELKCKIQRQIINDLRDNAIIKLSCLKTQVCQNIFNLKNIIKEKSGYEPNWLICSPDALYDIKNCYIVKCDEELNTPDVISRNELKAKIYLPNIDYDFTGHRLTYISDLHLIYVPEFNLKFFIDPFLPPNQILIGYKGEQDWQSCYHYIISEAYIEAKFNMNGFPENQITLYRAKQITNHSLFGLIELEDFKWVN